MSESPSTTAAEGRRLSAGVIARVVMRNWPAVLAALGLVFMQWPVYMEWWKQWTGPLSYYSHGPLVPIIVVVMVTASRRRLAASAIRPTWWGLLVLIPAILVYVLGRWIDSATLYGYTFLLLLLGGVLLLAGTRWTRILLIPIIFTASMVPASSSVLDKMTIGLQILSTKIAAWLLTITGYEAMQQGTVITSNYLPQSLYVGAVCSGFQLMISLITFTLFFVYMLQAPMYKKVVLLLFAVPLALFINSLRVAMIGYVGIWVGTADSMIAFHNWSGYIGLIICFAILFGLAKLMKAADFDFGGGRVATAGVSKTDVSPSRIMGTKGVAAFVLLVLGGIGAYSQPVHNYPKPMLVREAIPTSVEAWRSSKVQIDAKVLEYLKEGDLEERVYTNANDGRQVDVLMETASDPDAFHDPTACLPGSGTPVTAEVPIKLDVAGSRPPINATMLRVSGAFAPKIVIYWYESNGATVRNIPDLRRAIRREQMKQVLGLAAGVFGGGSQNSSPKAWVWYRVSSDVYGSDESEQAFLTGFISDFLEETGQVVTSGQ